MNFQFCLTAQVYVLKEYIRHTWGLTYTPPETKVVKRNRIQNGTHSFDVYLNSFESKKCTCKDFRIGAAL